MILTTTGRSIAIATICMVACAAPLSAQTRVRVTQDDTTIWTLGVPTVAAIVPAGTELEVVSRRGDWYEVVIPPPTTVAKRMGRVLASQVEPVASSPATPPAVAPAPDRPPAAPGPSQVPDRRPIVSSAGPAAAVPRGIQGFGQVGYGRFLAGESFDAVFDSPDAFWFGGGVRYGFGRTFVQGSVERFRKTGERVFVFENEVFPLGLEDTITLMPIAITAGYYFPKRTMLPYLGAGIGRYFVTEKAEFAEPGDDVKREHMSYHVLGGVEWTYSRLLAFAVEGDFTHVPDALDAGVAPLFNESNLGGFQIRVRVVVGR